MRLLFRHRAVLVAFVAIATLGVATVGLARERAASRSVGLRLLGPGELAAVAGMQSGPGEQTCASRSVTAGSACGGVGTKACPIAQPGCGKARCSITGCDSIPGVWILGGATAHNVQRKDCAAFSLIQYKSCEWDGTACVCNPANDVGAPQPCPVGVGTYWGSCTGLP